MDIIEYVEKSDLSELPFKTKELKVCPGCQRPEIHKSCPAWGTPIYMSGKLLTPELEKQYQPMRDEALKNCSLKDLTDRLGL